MLKKENEDTVKDIRVKIVKILEEINNISIT